MTLDNNQETFVHLWLKLEDTRASLKRDFRRFCIRNIMNEWAKEGIIRIGAPTPGRPYRPSEEDVEAVCKFTARAAWEELSIEKLNKRECSRLLRVIVAVQHDLQPSKTDSMLANAAYKIAFPKKKKQLNNKENQI